MKIFGVTSFLVAIAAVFVVLGVMSFRMLTLFAGVSPAIAQVLESLAPKVVQTDTHVIIFDNPLVDQDGMTVEEVQDNKAVLIGKEVVVKGAPDEVDEPWGFWLTDTSRSQDKLFVVTQASIANQNVDEFVFDNHPYVRIKGTIKYLTWTDRDSFDDLKFENGKSVGRSQRLVIVADEITPIVVGGVEAVQSE